MLYRMRLTLKTGQIWIQIRGDIPETVLNVLRQEYGRRLILRSEIGKSMTDVLNAPLYKRQPREMTPGDYLRFFRQDDNLTQAELAEKLGTMSRHRISDLENARRPISRMLALKLSRVFEVSSDKFVG